MSIFESFLKVGAGLDWVGPLMAMIQNYRNRPAVGYCIALQAGWITDILKAQGIKVWGIVAVNDDLIFSVRLAQARYTQYVLERQGVPYAGGIASPGEVHSNKARKSNYKPLDWFTSVLTRIDKLVDKI